PSRRVGGGRGGGGARLHRRLPHRRRRVCRPPAGRSMTTVLHSLGRPYFQRALLEAVLVGALGGVVGVHVLLRRLPFFVVAMSHATFPGVVLASVVGVSLFLGGTAFGLVVVALVV